MFIIRLLATIFEVITVLGAVFGAFLLFTGLLPGQSAIQTAAASATAVAFAAIPYSIAGVLHRMAMRSLKVEQVDSIFGD